MLQSSSIEIVFCGAQNDPQRPKLRGNKKGAQKKTTKKAWDSFADFIERQESTREPQGGSPELIDPDFDSLNEDGHFNWH